MSTLEIISSIVALAGGGGGFLAIVTLPSSIRRAAAEARSVEIQNLKKVIDEYIALSDERQETCQELRKQNLELDNKIDHLYKINSEWRDKYNAKCEELTELKVYKATNEVKICQRQGCPDRTPPTGF